MINNGIVVEDLHEIIGENINWERFRNKVVLVTGAAGILPSYMVETLLLLNQEMQMDIKVVGLVRNLEKAKKRFAHYGKDSALSLLSHDICQPLEYEGKIDFIIHAAGQASPKFYGKDPVGTAAGHAVGTYNMLQLAASKKVEGFLYFSTCAVYGYVADGLTDEKFVGRVDSLDIRSCYPEGKRMGEVFCRAFLSQYNVPVKILRIAHTYGPMMPLDDGRVFADFVGNIVRGEDINLNSDGSASRPMLYISDAVRAYFRVMLHGEDGEAYNVASDESITILNLAKLLVKLYPEKKLHVTFKKREAEGYIRSGEKGNIYSVKKLQDLGWEKHYSIEEGFKKTVDSYGGL